MQCIIQFSHNFRTLSETELERDEKEKKTKIQVEEKKSEKNKASTHDNLYPSLLCYLYFV